MIDEESVHAILHELSKMSPMVLGVAYLYAKNYEKYGVDITKEWTTATSQTAALDIAYHKGMKDALDCYAERSVARRLCDEDGNISCSRCGSGNCYDDYCGNCGAKMKEV